MHSPRIALIHATPVAIEPIVSAFRQLWPEAHGALAALHEGQPAEHDRLIAAAAAGMEDCEALILGQFSMASAADCIPRRSTRKVLTNPASAVTRLKRLFDTSDKRNKQ